MNFRVDVVPQNCGGAARPLSLPQATTIDTSAAAATELAGELANGIALHPTTQNRLIDLNVRHPPGQGGMLLYRRRCAAKLPTS
jgi:hypothetical protein